MGKLSETELKKLIKGGETNTVELKVAAPRAIEMAERLCGTVKPSHGPVYQAHRMYIIRNKNVSSRF